MATVEAKFVHSRWLGWSVSVFGLLGGVGIIGSVYWNASVWFSFLAIGGPSIAFFLVFWAPPMCPDSSVFPSEAQHSEQGLAWLASQWWIELPVRLARWTPSMASALTDGQYLMRWRIAAAVAPVVAFIAGIATQTVPDHEVFTTSWLTIVVLAGFGVLSVQLGFWAFVGYIAADLFAGQPNSIFYTSDLPGWLEWVAAPVALAVEYVLLGIGVVGIPVFLLVARLDLRRRGLAHSLGPTGERLTHIAVAGISYFVWTQALTTSIRTVFTFRDRPVPPEAVTTVQQQWPRIVVPILVMVTIRWLLESRAFHKNALAILKVTTRRFAEQPAKRNHTR